MDCKNCGKEVLISEKFCSYCGENNRNYNEDSNKINWESFKQETPRNSQFSANLNLAHAESSASTALTCGIIGFFFAGLILGVIAIVKGNQALKLGYSGGKASAGVVLGIIDIIGWAIIVFLYML